MPRLPLVTAAFATVVVIGCSLGTEPVCACPPAFSRVRVVGDVRTATGAPIPFARVVVIGTFATADGERRFPLASAFADAEGALDDTLYTGSVRDTMALVVGVQVPGSDDTVQVATSRLRFRYERDALLTDTLFLRLP